MTEQKSGGQGNTESPLLLEDYAKHFRISIDDVWRLIEDGALMARRINHEIYILQHAEQAAMLLPPVASTEQVKPNTRDLSPSQSPQLELQRWLLFSQETLAKMSKLNEDIAQSKDQLLEAKESQLSQLSQQMKTQESTIQGLRQQIEDLEMLARTLASRNPGPNSSNQAL